MINTTTLVQCTYPPPSMNNADVFVYNHCHHLVQGYIDFPRFHFYTMYNASLITLSIFIMSLALIIAFIFLGIVASEFFCPNLQSIVTALHLSESVAGVTFLAFGNGSPDLMATFTAMQSNSGGLAIGELIGASAFITTLVLGGVAIIAPFRLFNPGLLIRDALFFIGALVFLAVITNDGIMTTLESCILLGYYFSYVLVVFLTTTTTNSYACHLQHALSTILPTHVVGRRTDPDTEHQYTLLLPENQISPPQNVIIVEDDLVEQDHISDVSYISTTSLRYGRFTKKLSILDAVEYLDLYKNNAFDESMDLLTTPSPSQGPTRSNSSSCASPFLMPPTVTRSAPKRPSYITIPAFSDLHRPGTPIHLRRPSANSYRTNHSYPDHNPSIHNEPSDLLLSSDILVVENDSGGDTDPSAISLLFPILSHLRTRRKNLVTDFIGWMYILALVLVTPFFCVLRLTVPVIRQNSTSSFGTHVRHPVLCHVQNFLGSALATFIVLDGLNHPNIPSILSLPVGILVLLASLAIERVRPGTRHSVVWSSLGFMIGMLWIYMIANEVVTILKTLGAALGISEGMLGLTVFAIGNSVGDLIANLTMAKLGFPVMAVSACFASPMLNLVLGVGGSGAYLTMKSPSAIVELQVGTEIRIVNIALIFVVGFILFWLGVNRFFLGKGMGIGLIISYLLMIGGAIVFGLT